MKKSQKYQVSPNTSYKQASFRHVLAQTMWVISAIRNKHEWAKATAPLYIDLYAGRGRSADGEPGSPLIFCELAAQLPYEFEAHFYECDPESFAALSDNLQPFARSNYLLHAANNTDSLDLVPKRINHNRYGVIYADPSNAELDKVADLLRPLAAKFQLVDIVFNYAAASWKRQINLDHYLGLFDVLRTIPKQKWLIREPADRFQWTMLLGTNYIDFKASEKQYWHDTKTKIGKELLTRVALTNEQRRPPTQMELFK